jgi:hypothetical protein
MSTFLRNLKVRKLVLFVNKYFQIFVRGNGIIWLFCMELCQ